MKKELVKNKMDYEEMKRDFFAKEAELAAKELSDLEMGKVFGGEKYTIDSNGKEYTHYGHVSKDSVKVYNTYTFTKDSNNTDWIQGMVYSKSTDCGNHTFTVLEWSTGYHHKIESKNWTAWEHTRDGHINFG